MTETSTSTRERELDGIRMQVEGERDRLQHELDQLRSDGVGRDEAHFHEHPTDHAGEM